MRINFVLPYAGFSGGVRVIAIYASRLGGRGHQCTVISTPKVPYGRYEIGVETLCRLIGRRRTGGSFLDEAGVNHRIIERYRPIVDKDVPDADVTVATWWRTAEWVSNLSESKGAKVHFVQGHEVFPGQPIDRVKAAYRLPLSKITIAQWLAEVLKSEYACDDVPVIPNAVDPRQFYSGERGKCTVPTLGFLYSTAPVKGSDIVLAAIERIRQDLPSLRIIAFGTQDPPSGFEFPDGTEFVLRPSQDQLRVLYGSIDLWLCGSRSEGFHLMPLEAMACRTPVVSTRIGGATETIVDGVNGYLVDIGDSGSLADRAIRVLTAPPEQWLRMSNEALATSKRFSWESSTARLEAILSNIWTNKVCGSTSALP